MASLRWFFFFFPLLAHSLSSPPPQPSTLIQTTCRLTSNYDFCVAALQSDPRSLKAGDVKALSAIAVRIALARARSRSTYAANLTKNATDAAAGVALLRACADKYRSAGEALRWALESLKEENYDYASLHVSSAQEYSSTCSRLFRRSSPGVEYPDAMAKREDDLDRLCGTALDIISQLG